MKKKESIAWVLEVKKDKKSGDLFIELPQELLKRMGWKIGDTIVWEEDGDGYILKKTKK